MSAKAAITTIILRRLEVFWLEEWINHHLELGFDKFVIYDNGLAPVDRSQWSQGARKLSAAEKKAHKWKKKPDAEYFEEYSDQEISEKLLEIQRRHKETIEVIPWEYAVDHRVTYPDSQFWSIKHCLKSHSDWWWASLDPDEYLIFFECDNVQDLLHKHSGAGCLSFTQRVFKERVKGQKVRQIYKWGFDTAVNPKCLVKPPLTRFSNAPHALRSTHGKCVKIPPQEARFNHYRGDPLKSGGPTMRQCVQNHPKRRIFDKIDDSMKKYF